MPNATRRAAVVACTGGAAADTEEEPFFRRQFEAARAAAGDAAERLAAACSGNATRVELDRLSQRVSAAAAELRIAIQAARLNPARDLSPPVARMKSALMLALVSSLHFVG
jgi:hypothetical protein